MRNLASTVVKNGRSELIVVRGGVVRRSKVEAALLKNQLIGKLILKD
jgi:hypothetical protein